MTEEKKEAFIADILSVYKKHDLSIGLISYCADSDCRLEVSKYTNDELERSFLENADW